MSSRSRQKRTSGISANGIPNESTTWLSTSARDGSTPIAMISSAGAIVIARRSSSGMRRAMKPCITTWPAIVPTLEDESPEASRATPNMIADAGPEVRAEPVVDGVEVVADVVEAARVEDGRGGDQHAHVDQPGDRHRDDDVDELEAEDAAARLLRRPDDAVLRQRRVEVDHVRHARRAEDADREQHALGAVEAGHEEAVGDAGAGRVGLQHLEAEGDDDDADEDRDHGLEAPEAARLQREDHERRDAGQARGGEERHAGDAG